MEAFRRTLRRERRPCSAALLAASSSAALTSLAESSGLVIVVGDARSLNSTRVQPVRGINLACAGEYGSRRRARRCIFTGFGLLFFLKRFNAGARN